LVVAGRAYPGESAAPEGMSSASDAPPSTSVSFVHLRVSGFGIRDSGFGFRVSDFGIRVSGFGFRDSCFGFRVSCSLFRVSRFVFWVSDPTLLARAPHARLKWEFQNATFRVKGVSWYKFHIVAAAGGLLHFRVFLVGIWYTCTRSTLGE